MKEYISLQFAVSDDEQSNILVALLNELNPVGFEESENQLSVIFEKDNFSLSSIDEIAKNLKISFEQGLIIEENWNAQWESGFEPIMVLHPTTNKPFAFLRANFHPINDLADHNIEITPKMSFGTGHHATTYLMVEQMCQIDFNGKKVIDFGTGTGILAILAQKMGAEETIAIDNDDWSIENTLENIEKNKVSNISVIKAEEFVSNDNFHADVILANINLNVIIANLSAIKKAAKTNTSILFSGILEQDKNNLLTELQKLSMQIHEVKSRNNWVMIHAITC
jgi:ribosomal protein L11 methyltransferase